MPKHVYGDPEPFRGYMLIPRFTDGKLTLCDVYKYNVQEQDDERVMTFKGPCAKSDAKRWVLGQRSYPRISIRRVSNGR